MRLAGLLALPALAACASVDTPDRAAPELPAAYTVPVHENAVRDVLALLPLTDPAFATLRDRALSQGPTLAAALARIDAARAGFDASKAARRPNIDASASADFSRNSDGRFGGGFPENIPIDRYTELYSVGLNGSWDADIFGRLRARQQAAAERLDAATANAAAVRLRLIGDLAENVIAIRGADERLAAAETNIAEARDLVALTRTLSETGIVAGFDLVRARAILAAAEASAAPIRSERAARIGTLVALTTLPPAEVEAAFGPAVTASVPRAFDAGVPSALLAQRPDVRAAAARLRSADAEAAAAALQRYPSFQITATFGFIATSVANLFDRDALGASIVPGVTAPLLDFGRIGAEIDRRDAEAHEAFADYRSAVFGALGDVEAALVDLAATSDRRDAVSEQLIEDRDALSLAEQRYRAGISGFLEVIDAERALSATRLQFASAEEAQRRAAVGLYRAVGGVNPLTDTNP